MLRPPSAYAYSTSTAGSLASALSGRDVTFSQSRLNMRASTTTVEVSNGLRWSASQTLGDGCVGAVWLPGSSDGASVPAGSLKVRFGNAAKLANGRTCDVLLTLRGATVYGNDTAILGAGPSAGWPNLEAASLSGDSSSHRVESHWTVSLVKAGTDEPVNGVDMRVYFTDLDQYKDRVWPESVTVINSEVKGAVTHPNSYLRVSSGSNGQLTGYAAQRETDNNETASWQSGVTFLAADSTFPFMWQGQNCGTLLGLASTEPDFPANPAPDPVDHAISLKKVLDLNLEAGQSTSRRMVAGEFSFTLYDAAGKALQTKTNAANGDVKFDAIRYTDTGTYTYTIREAKGNAERTDYDTAVDTVTVRVTENTSTNKLVASESHTHGTFENDYWPVGRIGDGDGGTKKAASDPKVIAL